MRLKMAFSTHGPWESGIRTLLLPMEIALDPYGEFRVEEWPWPAGKILGPGAEDASRNLLVIVAERGVDPKGLTLKEDPILQWEDESGTVRPVLSIASPEIGELAEGAGLVFGAIGFAIGIALSFGPHEPGVPESVPPGLRARPRAAGEAG
jgi:hypothetical protein